MNTQQKAYIEGFIKRANEYGVDNIQAAKLLKLAENSETEENSKTEDKVLGALLASGGLAAVKAGKDPLLGLQKLYHGTSKEVAEKIKNQGLLAHMGGNPYGSSHAEGSAAYINNSRGKVHVGKGLGGKMIARMHANLAEAYREHLLKGTKKPFNTAKHYFKGLINNRGKVLGITMPHQSFLKYFEHDPDYGSAPAFRSSRSVESKYVKKHLLDIMPTLRSLKETNLIDYIIKNPGRFGKGLAMTGIGAFMLNNAKNRLFHSEEKEAS